MNAMPFAMVIERLPWDWADVPDLLFTWVEDAGGFAAFALVVWVVWDVVRRLLGQPAPAVNATGWSWKSPLFVTALVLSSGGFIAAICLKAIEPVPEKFQESPSLIKIKVAEEKGPRGKSEWIAFGASIFALGAVVVPFCAGLTKLSWRRIWALARLSFKEAIRRRVLWVFTALLIVFLFAGWFVPYKPEDQVRNYVRVVYWTMTPLLLLTAGLLAAFSIP